MQFNYYFNAKKLLIKSNKTFIILYLSKLTKKQL